MDARRLPGVEASMRSAAPWITERHREAATTIQLRARAYIGGRFVDAIEGRTYATLEAWTG
jgi:hypothetical protein